MIMWYVMLIIFSTEVYNYPPKPLVKESINRFYGVPFENKAFVERPDILAKMKEELDKFRILALSGLGGMGKTQLMLRYCYLHRATYEYIFWLEVDDWNVAVSSFQNLAIELGTNEKSGDANR